MKVRLALDPGTQRLGWAVGACRAVPDLRVRDWGGIEAEGNDWLQRCHVMLKGLCDGPLYDWELDEVVIEMPRNWDTGRGVGAKASGAILKLMFFVGCAAQLFKENGARVGFLGAGIWQGQLPKSVIYDRMNKRYKLDFPSDEEHWDISDAVGLLHYSHEMGEKIQWLR